MLQIEQNYKTGSFLFWIFVFKRDGGESLTIWKLRNKNNVFGTKITVKIKAAIKKEIIEILKKYLSLLEKIFSIFAKIQRHDIDEIIS